MPSKKYWMAGAERARKSALYSLRHFISPQNSRNEPIAECGLASGLIFFDRRAAALLEKYDVSVTKCINPKSKTKNPPKTHLRSYVSAFREFVRIARISYMGQSDFEILHIGSEDWESVYQRPRNRMGEFLSQPYQPEGVLSGL